MTHLATAQFLDSLKAHYPFPRAGNDGPDSIVQNPWYLVAAVAFSASNRPEEVPLVFQYVLQDLEKQSEITTAEKLNMARKVREAVFQAGLLCGYGRTINSLVALHEAMPEELREKNILRDTTKNMQEYARDGQEFFRPMYGDLANNVQDLLDRIYPDIGWFSNTIGYGITYGGTKVLSQVETSYIIATANIAMDTPRQIAWHLANAQTGGATLGEVRAVRQIAMEVASKSDVQWREGVPEVKP